MADNENTNQAIERRGGETAISTLKDFLSSAGTKSRLLDVVPRHLTPDRLVRIALGAAHRNPQILQCSKESILFAIMEGAQLGLEVGAPDGRAYLVPRRNKKTGKLEAQFQLGYRGLIELARRSGMVASAEARLVRDKDLFEQEFGLTPKLVHRPYLGGDAGPVKLAYSIIRLKDPDAEPIVDVMTRGEIETVRAGSPAGQSGPWVNHWGEMARKTVLRRNMKYAPMSAEETVRDALAVDAARDGGDETIDVTASTVPEAPVKSRVDEVKAKLKGKRGVQVQLPSGETVSAEDLAAAPPPYDGPPPGDVDEHGYSMTSDREPGEE